MSCITTTPATATPSNDQGLPQAPDAVAAKQEVSDARATDHQAIPSVSSTASAPQLKESSSDQTEEDKKEPVAISKPSNQSSTIRREGAWRSDAPYVGAKALRLLIGPDGTFQGSYLEGIVNGWLPAAEADYVNPASGEPEGLWRVRYEKVRPLLFFRFPRTHPKSLVSKHWMPFAPSSSLA